MHLKYFNLIMFGHIFIFYTEINITLVPTAFFKFSKIL